MYRLTDINLNINAPFLKSPPLVRYCRYNLHYFYFFKVHIFVKNDTSAMPEVRGTADVGWRSLFPLPINPPRTHSRLYHHMCLRQGWGQVQLTKYSSTPSTTNIYQVQVLAKYSFF